MQHQEMIGQQDRTDYCENYQGCLTLAYLHGTIGLATLTGAADGTLKVFELLKLFM